MKEAHTVDFVLPNHDREDSEIWNAYYYPIGDATNTLEAVKQILASNKSSRAKYWSGELLQIDHQFLP